MTDGRPGHELPRRVPRRVLHRHEVSVGRHTAYRVGTRRRGRAPEGAAPLDEQAGQARALWAFHWLKEYIQMP